MTVLTMRRAVLLGAALIGCLSALACFSPKQPTCAFSCAADGLCPAGYSCSAADGWCHLDGAQDAMCTPSQLDAGGGTDGAAGDGAADGAADADATGG